MKKLLRSLQPQRESKLVVQALKAHLAFVGRYHRSRTNPAHERPFSFQAWS